MSERQGDYKQHVDRDAQTEGGAWNPETECGRYRADIRFLLRTRSKYAGGVGMLTGEGGMAK